MSDVGCCVQAQHVDGVNALSRLCALQSSCWLFECVLQCRFCNAGWEQWLWSCAHTHLFLLDDCFFQALGQHSLDTTHWQAAFFELLLELSNLQGSNRSRRRGCVRNAGCCTCPVQTESTQALQILKQQRCKACKYLELCNPVCAHFELICDGSTAVGLRCVPLRPSYATIIVCMDK